MKKYLYLFISLLIGGIGQMEAQSLSGVSISSCFLNGEEMTAVIGEVVAFAPIEGSYLDAGFIEVLLAEAVGEPDVPIVPDPDPEEPDNPTSVDPVEAERPVFVREGNLYVRTPVEQRVDVIALSGQVVYSRKQVGTECYPGLSSGAYLVRVDEKVFKVMVSR